MKIESKNRRLFIFLISIFVVASITVIVAVKLHQKEGKNCVLLNAEVKLDDGKITITNNDSFDYIHTELYINKHYKIIGFNIPAGESSILWQVEFSNYFRRRMSHNEKAITFSIVCDLYDGEKGVYYIDFSKSK
ncbi:hypothetical protein [Roseimarinus sediminis]|uniref:hypothetical protein n=1 Tax=Roseimarinus sediminis TaxID=1610899 RepID=UPI003D25A897